MDDRVVFGRVKGILEGGARDAVTRILWGR